MRLERRIAFGVEIVVELGALFLLTYPQVARLLVLCVKLTSHLELDDLTSVGEWLLLGYINHIRFGQVLC